jgi:hypothetical protein
MSLGCTLSACGGGGGGPSNTPQTDTAPAIPTCGALFAQDAPLPKACHITIAWDGDSTNYGADIDNTSNEVQYPGIGNGIAGRASPTPAQMLQAKYDAKYGSGVVTVLDISIPGSTFESDVNGTAPNPAPLAARLAALPVHADAVVSNDEINSQYNLGLDAQTFASDAQKWINVVVAYGAVPVYVEPNPISRSDMNISDPNTGTNALVYAVDAVFTSAGYAAVGNLSEWENYTSPPNAQPWNIAWMSSDGVHPNQAGYAEKISNYFYGVPNAMGNTYNLNQVVADILAERQS